MKKKIVEIIDEHKNLVNSIPDLYPDIELISKQCVQTLEKRNKIFLFGNGGSASDAQHIAAEIIGRFKNDRTGLPAIALSTDTSVITSIANDFGYDLIFSRQVESLAEPGDTVIGLSTSGTSTNVINGLIAAKTKKCFTIGFTGNNGGDMKSICDASLIIPSINTARIQEMHILCGHIIAEIIDVHFTQN